MSFDLEMKEAKVSEMIRVRFRSFEMISDHY